MKSIAKWILVAIAIIGVVLIVGCQHEAFSIQSQSQIETVTKSTPPPEGFRAIAATEGSAEQKAERSVRTMSRSDKIGQLMMIGVNGTTLDGLGRDQIHTYRLGGIVLDNENMDTKQQVKDFIELIKSTADVASLAPLFIGVDREQVKHKRDLMVSFPTPPQLGRQTEASLRNSTTRMAIEMHDMGFNVQLGPTVNTRIRNSYSTDVSTMALVGEAFARSFKTNHVYVAYNYFPTGTEYGLVGVSLPVSKEELADGDMAVFRQILANTKEQTPMIMVNAVIIPDVDTLPVSLSKTILTDMARTDMQYNGVIISDKLESSAAATKLSIGDYAVQTILAGSDMVIVGKQPKQIQEVHKALVTAVDEGVISEERLNESVRRIMYMKYTM